MKYPIYFLRGVRRVTLYLCRIAISALIFIPLLLVQLGAREEDIFELIMSRIWGITDERPH